MLPNTNQQRALEQHGWYAGPAPDHSGFEWFLSGDARFPARILFPVGHRPFYDFNRPDDLVAEFPGSFNLVCQDTGINLLATDLARYVKEDLAQRERAKAAANPYHGGYTFNGATKISVQKNVRVGSAGIPAVRVQWDRQGEAYCFAGYPRRSSLWSIRRNCDEIGDQAFATVVASFGWLKPEFFDLVSAKFRFG